MIHFFKKIFDSQKDPEDIKKLFEYLISITPGKTVSEEFKSRYEKLLRKSKKQGHKVFFKFYLSWEEYLLSKKSEVGEPMTKEQLRNKVAQKIDTNGLDEEFRIIFLEEKDQLLHLYENLIQRLAAYIQSNIGFKTFQTVASEAGANTPFEKLIITKEKIDFSHLNSYLRSRPAEYPIPKITNIFKVFVSVLYSRIESVLGEKTIESIFQKLYDNMRDIFSAEFASLFLKITPEKILGLDQWLSVLSKSELEKEVKEKTAALESLNLSLEQRVTQRTEELQKAYDELKELDKKKSDFISVAAHQIRTPLSGIKWILNMLVEDDEALTDEQKSFLLKANEANEKLLLIVNDILDTDLISTGKAVYDFKEIDCFKIIEEVISDLQPQAKIKNIRLIFKNQSRTNGNMEADEKRMRSVIQNLIDNAVKYSNKDSKITIETEKTFDNLLIKISDTGIGIPEDQQVDIFKRFFRAQNSMRAHTNGSGLGLFIAQSIINEHHGLISFESEENKGTAFTISLPLKQPKQ